MLRKKRLDILTPTVAHKTAFADTQGASLLMILARLQGSLSWFLFSFKSSSWFFWVLVVFLSSQWKLIFPAYKCWKEVHRTVFSLIQTPLCPSLRRRFWTLLHRLLDTSCYLLWLSPFVMYKQFIWSFTCCFFNFKLICYCISCFFLCLDTLPCPGFPNPFLLFLQNSDQVLPPLSSLFQPTQAESSQAPEPLCTALDYILFHMLMITVHTSVSSIIPFELESSFHLNFSKSRAMFYSSLCPPLSYTVPAYYLTFGWVSNE